MSIIIPVRGSTNTVEVFNDELPEDPGDVIDLLRAELAPLDTWCEFAVAYHGQDRHEQFREILHGVVDAFDVYEMQDFYRREPLSFENGRLRILNLLAASATNNFVNEELRKDTREAWRQKALEYIGRADKISTNCPQTWLVKALFWIGEQHHDEHALRNAAYYVDSSLRSNGGISCNSRLAKAAILFHDKKYAEALRYYVNAIRSDPLTAGASARVGVGLCAYHLGDKAKATVAFERALILNPLNVEALVAMALLRLDFACAQAEMINISSDAIIVAKSLSRTGIDGVVRMISRATELKPTYSIALNHYANHLFWNWQKMPFTAYTTSGNADICCSADPTPQLLAGAVIRFGGDDQGNGAVEAIVLDGMAQRTSENRWILKLTAPISCIVRHQKEQPVCVKYVTEVDNLASRAYHCTMVPEIQAEAYFILGRNSHARGNIQSALPYYTQACNLWPRFALAQFRLAQVRTAMGDIFSATEAAEAAFALAPRAPEVLRLLGMLRLERQLDEDALQVLRLAVSVDENDAHAWLALARAEERASIKHRGTEYENHAIEMAVNAYKNARELLYKRGFRVPYQANNNMGVLQLEQGSYQSASAMLVVAIGSKNRNDNDSNFVAGELGSTTCVENVPLWLWERTDGQDVWFDKSDPRTLLTNILIEPPLRVDEKIRIGDNNVATFCQVKATSLCQKKKNEQREQSAGMSRCGFLIHLSEPIRQFNATTRSQPLYRLRRSIQTQLTSSTVSVYANLAQLHATAGASTAALELAQAAFQLQPSIRCLLLLARLTLITHEHDHAQIYIDDAVELALTTVGKHKDNATLERTADALAVACALQYELKDENRTLSMLENLRSLGASTLRADAYANVTLGKLHFAGVLKDDQTAGYNNHSCRVQQLKHAADCARVVLRQDSSCAAAAHMLGLTLLELGQLDDAALIFERVRENTLGFSPSIVSGADAVVTSQPSTLSPSIAWGAAVNLAHAHLLSRRWAEAAVGYAACVKAVPVVGISLHPATLQTKRADLNHWLARARHGANNITGASRALSAAIHLRPGDHLLRCRSAVLILERVSGASLNSPRQYLPSLVSTSAVPLHCNEAESAVKELAVARKVFQWLKNDHMYSENDFTRLLPEDLLTKCDAILQKVF